MGKCNPDEAADNILWRLDTCLNKVNSSAPRRYKVAATDFYSQKEGIMRRLIRNNGVEIGDS
jgi:hypothetical protein